MARRHRAQRRYGERRTAPADRRKKHKRPEARRRLCRSEERRLTQREQHDADDGEAADAGVLQNFAPPRKIAAGAHGVGHVHEAVEMDEARHDEGVCAEYRALHKRRERQIPAEPREKRPDRADLQPDDGQEQKHFIARFLVPHAPKARDRAEHAPAHGQSVQILFQNGSTPLWTMRRPAASSTTVSHSRASIRSIPASARRYCSVMGSYSPASEKI